MGLPTLPVSRLIQVAVTLSPQAAVGRNFGDLLLVGDSNVISGLERIRDYSDAPTVAQDLGAMAPEAIAAALYFGQSPQPTSLSVGRWIRTATAGMAQGAILTAAQSALSLFTQITSGGFGVTIDGTPIAVTALNFSTALNLNGVASAITAALAGAGTAIWSGAQFVISSATTGAGIPASGSITFTGQPAANDTVTVNGIVVTFVNAITGANQVLIGATDLLTAVNLNTFLNASTSPNILQASYSVNGLVVTATFKQVGVSGNAFTLAKSSANITLSAANLSGGVNPSSVSYLTAPGSGQDVSALLGLTAALALPLVPGYAAETPLQAVSVLDSASTEWFGLMFAASVMPSDSDNLAIAPFIEADENTRMFGVTIQNTNVLSSEVTNDLASELLALGVKQTFTEYSSTNPYAVASAFGRMFSVNFTGQNTTIIMMFKQLPGVAPENLTTEEANTLQAKRCNVFAAYNNSTALFQYGTMAGSAYMDEIHGLDSLQNALQTALFNVNYTSPTKIPQTDDGDQAYVNAAAQVMQQYVTNGLGAPGIWNGPAFGQLQTGQYLKLGYYIFIASVASQSQSDRDARLAPPIQIAFKLAGGNQDVDVLLQVNR